MKKLLRPKSMTPHVSSEDFEPPDNASAPWNPFVRRDSKRILIPFDTNPCSFASRKRTIRAEPFEESK